MAGARCSYAHHCGVGGRHVGTPTAVRSSSVVTCNPDYQDRTQVRLRYRNHPVQTLAVHVVDHPSTNRVPFRTTGPCFSYLYPLSPLPLTSLPPPTPVPL